MGIPWIKINDYLAELGSVDNLDEFAGQALEGISRIIPFDANAMFVNVDELGRIRSWKTVADSEKWLAPFNSYYYRTMSEVEVQDIVAVDWHNYRDREYANDFIKPQGYRYTIGVFRLGYQVNEAAALSVHRSANSRQFNEAEERLCQILHPHLTNLFTLISKITHSGNTHLFPAELIRDCKLLSKREAEIAFLLCRKLTAPEIATKLLISRRTVEFHVTNIYEKMKVKNRQELMIKLAGK